MKLWPRAKVSPIGDTSPDDAYAREVVARISAGLDSSGVRRVRPETVEERSWDDEGGVESGHVAPLVLAPPPFDMPPQGSCCAGCPGYTDKRCCARGS